MEFRKILWPTDFSKNAAQALPYVTSLTEKYQTEIHLLYVMQALEPDVPWYGALEPAHIEKIRKWEEKVAKKHLDEICTKYLNGCPKYIKHITDYIECTKHGQDNTTNYTSHIWSIFQELYF